MSWIFCHPRQAKYDLSIRLLWLFGSDLISVNPSGQLCLFRHWMAMKGLLSQTRFFFSKWARARKNNLFQISWDLYRPIESHFELQVCFVFLKTLTTSDKKDKINIIWQLKWHFCFICLHSGERILELMNSQIDMGWINILKIFMFYFYVYIWKNDDWWLINECSGYFVGIYYECILRILLKYYAYIIEVICIFYSCVLHKL